MNKFILTALTVCITLVANAQSPSQAQTTKRAPSTEEFTTKQESIKKQGNQVFANAMIRNSLIIGGVLLVFFLLKSGSGKSSAKE